MLELYQQFILPLFFETKQKNKLVNKVNLYVTKEVVSYIEDEEGNVVKEINRIETAKTKIYEGKVTMDPNKMRKFMYDPINYPQKNPEVLEEAVTIEQKDMVSSVYEIINSTLSGFTDSTKILMNSVGFFFGGKTE